MPKSGPKKPQVLANNYNIGRAQPYSHKLIFDPGSNFRISEVEESRLDYKLCLPSVNLDSNFTKVMESARIADSDDLVSSNKRLVAGQGPLERDSHHDSGRLDSRSRSNSYYDRISSSAGEL